MSTSSRTTRDVTLRARRQLTLPADACEALGLQVGDRLEVSVSDGALVIKSKRASALALLHKIREALSNSGISEEEFQEEGRRIREQIAREQYGLG